jgi:hypothetical protein
MVYQILLQFLFFGGQSSPGFLRRTVEEISPLQVADPEKCAFTLEH